LKKTDLAPVPISSGDHLFFSATEDSSPAADVPSGFKSAPEDFFYPGRPTFV